MALTPEQKMQVIAEIQRRPDTTPEQKKRLGILWTKNLEKTEQGLIPQDPVQTLTKGAEAGGMVAAEEMGEKGLNPQIAAGIGTAISMAPDLLMGAAGLKPAVGALEDAAAVGKAGITKAGQVINTLKGPSLEEAKALRQVADAGFRPETALKAEQFSKNIIDPVKAEVDSIASRLSQLPGKTADKLKVLQDKLGMAGKEMGAAEDAAGFGFKSTPEFEAAVKNPKTMEKTLKVAQDFTKMGPEKVAETIDAKTIQQTRKLIQEGSKEKTLSDLGNATMQQGREVAAKALGI